MTNLVKKVIISNQGSEELGQLLKNLMSLQSDIKQRIEDLAHIPILLIELAATLDSPSWYINNSVVVLREFTELLSSIQAAPFLEIGENKQSLKK